MDDWGDSFPTALASDTTVCLYSHAGGNGSSPAVEPITLAAVLSDADEVLAAMKAQAAIDGPYVFVGWSFGGEVALAEATEDPSRTAGVVILDTDFPRDSIAACRKSGRSATDCRADFNGDLEAKRIEADIVARIKPLPGIPIALVSAMRPGPDCALAPGASAVTYSVDGLPVNAPDCVTLLQRVADQGLTDWRTLGQQVQQTRVDADHDGLIRIAGPQIVDVTKGVLAQTH